MPRIPRQARSRATYDAIVEAGFICVAERGLSGTTTRHIAKVAGIGVGSLYEYFENKEAVFDQMTKHFVDEVVVMLEPLAAPLARMPIGDAVEQLLGHFEAFLNQNDQRYLRWVRQAMSVDIADYMQPVTTALTAILMQHVMHHPEQMQVRNIPAMSYILIHGGIFAVVQHLSDPNPPVTYAELTQGLADLVDHYVTRELQLASEDRG